MSKTILKIAVVLLAATVALSVGVIWFPVIGDQLTRTADILFTSSLITGVFGFLIWTYEEE